MIPRSNPLRARPPERPADCLTPNDRRTPYRPSTTLPTHGFRWSPTHRSPCDPPQAREAQASRACVLLQAPSPVVEDRAPAGEFGAIDAPPKAKPPTDGYNRGRFVFLPQEPRMLLASLRSGRRFGWLLGWMLLLAASPARGGEPLVLKIWPGDVPGEQGDVGPERLLEPRGERPVQRLTDVSEPTIAVYLPKENATGAAVLICPGGGYSILAMDLEGEEVAAWLNRQGVAGIVSARVLSCQCPKHEACKTATGDELATPRRRLGIDPRIGILGFPPAAPRPRLRPTSIDEHRRTDLKSIRFNCRPASPC